MKKGYLFELKAKHKDNIFSFNLEKTILSENNKIAEVEDKFLQWVKDENNKNESQIKDVRIKNVTYVGEVIF